MARTLSFRIATPLASRVAEQSARWGYANDSEIYRQVVEEWSRLQEHPGIRFVDGPAGRRAALVEGPDVWQVIGIAKAYDFRADEISEAYPWLSDTQLAAALAYYDAYPEEIEAALERNAQAAADLERELELLER
jgi:hypothetical protein